MGSVCVQQNEVGLLPRQGQRWNVFASVTFFSNLRFVWPTDVKYLCKDKPISTVTAGKKWLSVGSQDGYVYLLDLNGLEVRWAISFKFSSTRKYCHPLHPNRLGVPRTFQTDTFLTVLGIRIMLTHWRQVQTLQTFTFSIVRMPIVRFVHSIRRVHFATNSYFRFAHRWRDEVHWSAKRSLQRWRSVAEMEQRKRTQTTVDWLRWYGSHLEYQIVGMRLAVPIPWSDVLRYVLAERWKFRHLQRFQWVVVHVWRAETNG